MRKPFEPQLRLGQIPIEDIEFDPQCRDEITQLLVCLQAIFGLPEIRSQVLGILERLIPGNLKNGRPGMDLWKILVLGTLKLNCDWDFDKLANIANNHIELRMMMFHTPDDRYRYALRTVAQNIKLFTPEILDEINRVVVGFGHNLCGMGPDDSLFGSADSMPVETDVHFPTDISLLFDAISKIITLVPGVGRKGWRKWRRLIDKARKLWRDAQNKKKRGAKDKKKREKINELIIRAHIEYIAFARKIVARACETLAADSGDDILASLAAEQIWDFIGHANRQIDQIERRVVNGEKIPHAEKVFSIFEGHTEWISKGKAGVPQQLGLNVRIVRDQHGFILHHRVMENETDGKIAVPIVRETIERFPQFSGCSFDRGFHTPDNQKILSEILDRLVLPKKGKPAPAESTPEFKERRKKHSAVESSLSALKNHGLERCRDHGIDGFRRHVALAVLARNIQIVGNLLLQEKRKREKRAA